MFRGFCDLAAEQDDTRFELAFETFGLHGVFRRSKSRGLRQRLARFVEPIRLLAQLLRSSRIEPVDAEQERIGNLPLDSGLCAEESERITECVTAPPGEIAQ